MTYTLYAIEYYPLMIRCNAYYVIMISMTNVYLICYRLSEEHKICLHILNLSLPDISFTCDHYIITKRTSIESK